MHLVTEFGLNVSFVEDQQKRMAGRSKFCPYNLLVWFTNKDKKMN